MNNVLKTLKCVEPWLSKFIADESHKRCVLPNDAIKTLNAIRTAIMNIEKNITWQSMETAPTGWKNYFLVRPKGLHQRYEKPYTPIVVQQLDGALYIAEFAFKVGNELEPLHFDKYEPLEWHELPE